MQKESLNGIRPVAMMSIEAHRPESIVFVLLDGVGIGSESGNPLAEADMPFLDAMLDGVRPTAGHPWILTDRVAFSVDACLGVNGRPQSATGQAALLSGRNVTGELGGTLRPQTEYRGTPSVGPGHSVFDSGRGRRAYGIRQRVPSQFFRRDPLRPVPVERHAIRPDCVWPDLA